MAHERKPPKGYIECFMPNVKLLSGKRIVILKRNKELTSDKIIKCERTWAKKVEVIPMK